MAIFWPYPAILVENIVCVCVFQILMYKIKKTSERLWETMEIIAVKGGEMGRKYPEMA